MNFLEDIPVSGTCRKSLLRPAAALLLLCLTLPACAANAPGLSLGLGTGGVGFGLHSGYGGSYGGHPYGGVYAGRRYSGVQVGVPLSLGQPRDSDGRIVSYEPARPPITEESHAAWNRYDDMYHSKLSYYRGKPFR